MKKLLIIAGIILCVYLCYITFEPNRDKYPFHGIDVSHHQGKIDWQLVANDDVQFAYIKATEGGDFKDSSFKENWQAAKEAGLARGAYHFFTLCISGKAQAKNFINVVPVGEDALSPAIDLEFGGNCSQRPSKEEFLRELKDFSEMVEQHYKRKPVLYVTSEFKREYLSSEKGYENLWIRGIVLKPSDKLGWSIWQYHNRGHVNGISGPVDLNVLQDGVNLDRFLSKPYQN